MNGRDDATKNSENSLGVSWGASYDLGVTKPMILVQYGKNENKLGGWEAADVEDYNSDDHVGGTNEGFKGFAVSLGTVTPLFGGNLYTSVNYTDGETENDVGFGLNDAYGKYQGDDAYFTGDLQRWGVAVGYDYPLSKRTKVYGFAAYNEGEFKASFSGTDLSAKIEEKDLEAGVGLIHYF